MTFLQDFKAFVMRGNVVDLAIGVIIGVAFGKVVTSLVNDVIMPPIGALLGGMDFSALQMTVKAATSETPSVVIKYGTFINTIVDFVIVAFAVFLLSQVSKIVVPTATTTRPCPECLMTIPIGAKRCGYCTCRLTDQGR